MKFLTSICVAGYTLITLTAAVPYGHPSRSGSHRACSAKSARPALATGSTSTAPNAALSIGNTTFPITNATLAGNATTTLTEPSAQVPTVKPVLQISSAPVKVNLPSGVPPPPPPPPPPPKGGSRTWGPPAPSSPLAIPPIYSSPSLGPPAASPQPPPPPPPPSATISQPATPPVVTSAPPSTPVTSSQASTPTSTSPASPPPGGNGRVKYGGLNIAGFDFGCDIYGSCKAGGNLNVVTNGNALAQMNHFVGDDGLNTFRLPVGWQFLVNNGAPGGTIDPTNLAAYDALVQGCLKSGAAMCMIDIHNYARYNGGIVGQGGPSNADFANLWSQLAKKYAGESRIAFDIMNEPHDLEINTWANTAQAAVTAIRNAGANSQVILLPGTGFTSAASFVSSGSADALSRVKNPDGSTTNLVFNVHKYLDADGTGTTPSCVTNNIDSSFAPLAAYLRKNNRQAMLTETGGGPNDQSCMQFLCQQMDYINQNSDVYLGVMTWAAGGFTSGYELLSTPLMRNNALVDQPLVSQCVVAKLGNKAAAKRWVPPLL